MWLLDGNSLRLVFFANEDETPPYAILSHTWSDEEVSFQDIISTYTGRDLATKTGWSKIENACRLALSYGLDYVWIDTCCIDKTSSAELQEAINSMFKWYELSAICFAYLSDVSASENVSEQGSSFRRSRWFKRGWTLQELLAPIEVAFYDKDWKPVARRENTGDLIEAITGIRKPYLSNEYGRHEGIYDKLSVASVAERMSWMDKRETTRPEDLAYCLLGIFDINMPMLYGEGSKAFQRLQEEIMKKNDDTSLLSWGYLEPSSDWHLEEDSLLAPHPSYFRHCRDITPCTLKGFNAVSFTMNQRGLQIEVPVRDDLTHNLLVYMILSCGSHFKINDSINAKNIFPPKCFVAIPLISTRACSVFQLDQRAQKGDYLRPKWCRPTLVSEEFLRQAKSASIVIRTSSEQLRQLQQLPISITPYEDQASQGYLILGTYPPQPIGRQLISLYEDSSENLPDSTVDVQQPLDLHRKSLMSTNCDKDNQTMIHIRIPVLGTFVVVLEYREVASRMFYSRYVSQCLGINCRVFKLPKYFDLEAFHMLSSTQDFTHLPEVSYVFRGDHYTFNIGMRADVYLVIHLSKEEMATDTCVCIELIHPPVNSYEQAEVEWQERTKNRARDATILLFGSPFSGLLDCVQQQLKKDFSAGKEWMQFA